MKFEEVKELIELINNSDLTYFELKNKEDYMKLDKSLSRNNTSYINGKKHLDKEKLVDDEEINNNKDNKLKQDKDTKEEDNFEYIKSPIVGTFYKKTSPTSDDLVNIGKVVEKGEVVCIVEAMKLMNEISVDFKCEIISVMVEDGDMVEYNQPLLKVRRI